jgi:predicted acyl esterase
VERFTFDMLPLSYLFKRGHRIRIAIAGADADHFVRIPDRTPTLTIYRDPTRPSRVTLPIMPRVVR